MPKKTKHPGGRPPKYKTSEELQIAIDKYFAEGITLKQVVTGPPTKREIQEIAIPGVCDLALYLGFMDRQSLRDYAEKGEYSCVIKNAISRIEAWNETNLVANNSTGSIFWLKNHNWSDKTEIQHGFTGSFADFIKGIRDARNDRPGDLIARRAAITGLSEQSN